MRRFVHLCSLGWVFLGLVGCGAAATAPAPVGESPAPAQPSAALPAAPAPTDPPVQPTPSAVAVPTPANPTAAGAPEAPSGWSRITAVNDGPAPRHDHSAVLDPVRQQVVVFGGRGGAALGDTWLFDLGMRTWREVPGDGPMLRFGHGAVYDAAGRRMLVVMGQGDTFFNDVWAFDLERETWSELAANDPAAGKPRPRYGQSAALDSRGHVLISHGFSDQGRFDDTWSFDAASGSWVELTPAAGPRPLKRCLHALAYEAESDRLLLYGGCSSGFGPCPQGDLWAFDLQRAAWTELTPGGAAPAARSDTSLAYEPASRSLLLFGGKTAAGVSAETWRFDLSGFVWTQQDSGEAPAPRSNQATAADAATGRVIVVGGLGAQGSTADVWQWVP